MAFTNDQSVLNGINMDVINQYQQYMNALQPLLLDQSGYKKTLSETNISEATKSKLAVSQKDLDIYNRGRANQLTTPEETAQFSQIVQKYYGGSPQNSNQWNDADANIRNQLSQQIGVLQNQAENEKVGFELTPEAKANQEAYKSLAATQLQQLQDQATYLNSPEYKAQLQQQQEIANLQQKNTLALQKRQADALAGNIKTSPVLQKQINDNFQQFKEAQAKAGNIILGDSIENAVGKGSAATESLAAFQANADALKQQEIDNIINTGTGLSINSAQASSGLFSGLNLGNTGQFASTTFNQAYGTPQSPNYSGLSQLALAGQQPYQFDQQLYLQQQQMNNAIAQQNASRKSGLLSGGLQLAGTIGGAIIGGPAGAAVGGQLGSIVGGQGGSMNYSPQFGQTWSPY